MIVEVPGIETVQTFQTDMAGRTVEWWGEDNPERLAQLLEDPVKGKILRSNDWHNRKVIYQFNQHGFRGNEFDSNDQHFCVFGDSVTFGMALEQECTYGHLLEKETGLKCFNLGHAGGSDSASARLAITFLPKLSPKFVVLQTTFDHRFEWIEQNNRGITHGVRAHGGGAPPTGSGDLYRNWVDIDLNRLIHRAKNIMCIRYICQQQRIPLIELAIEDFFCPLEETARDLLHPGSKSHAAQATRLLDKLKGLDFP